LNSVPQPDVRNDLDKELRADGKKAVDTFKINLKKVSAMVNVKT
jgi:hypothetical protein